MSSQSAFSLQMTPVAQVATDAKFVIPQQEQPQPQPPETITRSGSVYNKGMNCTYNIDSPPTPQEVTPGFSFHMQVKKGRGCPWLMPNKVGFPMEYIGAEMNRHKWKGSATVSGYLGEGTLTIGGKKKQEMVIAVPSLTEQEVRGESRFTPRTPSSAVN